MITAIVTGGIATGKSAFLERYLHHFPEARVFDSDRCVHELLTTGEVVRLVRSAFGNGVLDDDGRVSRIKLRDIVFGDRSRRRLLEEILHPRVRQCCREEKETLELVGNAPVFLADVPVYYESQGFDIAHHEVVVVATSPAVQFQRLCARPRMTPSTAKMMIGAQLPLPLKMERADRVVWNDGSLGILESQAILLSATHRALSPR